MRLGQARSIDRLQDRLSIRVLIVGALALAALIVVVSGFLIIRNVVAGQIDDLVTERGDNIALVLAAAADADQLDVLADDLVLLEDVQSIAYFASGNGGLQEIQAYPADGQLDAGAELMLADYVASGQNGPASDRAGVIRLIEVEGLAQAETATEFVVAIELDRGAVGADLQSGFWRSTVFLLAGTAILVLVAYMLLVTTIVRPLTSVARLRPNDARSLDLSALPADAANEITSITRLVAVLANEAYSSSGSLDSVDYLMPDSLPGVWLVVDDNLRVIESRFAVSNDDGEEVVTLALSHVSDLLSAAVVEYLAETVRILSPGEEDEFEFSVGVKSYVASVRAEQHDFILEIGESPADIHALQPSPAAASEVLEGLLSSMPFGILESDEDGSILYANGNPFDIEDSNTVVGKSVVELLPGSVAADAHKAFRDARFTLDTQTFAINPDQSSMRTGSTNYVVPLSVGDGLTYFVMSVPLAPAQEDENAEAKITALEENLWSLELRISQYEDSIAQLTAERDALKESSGSFESEADTQFASDVEDSTRQLLEALNGGATKSSSNGARLAGTAWAPAALSLASVLDEKLGTDYSAIVAPPEVAFGAEDEETRFHLATFLDKIAIEATENQSGTPMRLSVFIQPSLPKSLFGVERTARLAIFQMIEFARIVAKDRPLTLAAMQDTSEGRLVRVRFEIQIPPPTLQDEDVAILRGCVSGELPDEGVTPELRAAAMATSPQTFEALDLEVVKLMPDAIAIRCSANFDIAEEVDTDYGWVRGLRTLLIQDVDAADNGVQAALGAFGIIGYVVSDEESLAEALQIGEEYSNPYRFVIADADTPRLDSIAGELLSGDAPVVLVGTRSDSAMVSALAAGYSGYVSKPVRQVELLEVILSTVEPPDVGTEFDDYVSVA